MAPVFHAKIGSISYVAVNARDEQEARWEVEMNLRSDGCYGLLQRWIDDGRRVEVLQRAPRLRLVFASH